MLQGERTFTGKEYETDNLKARIRPGRGKIPEVLCTMVPKGKSAERLS
jgi:hypothetical protein